MKFKKDKISIMFNDETQIAIVKCSICTGEQVAGFKDKKTGHFTDIMLINNEKDLEDFKKMYNIENIVKEY